MAFLSLLCNLSNRDAEPIWLWSSIIGATAADIYRAWQNATGHADRADIMSAT
jgi:hypothetical protein